MAHSYVNIKDGRHKGRVGFYVGKDDEDDRYHNIIVSREGFEDKKISLHFSQFEHKPFVDYLNGW